MRAPHEGSKISASHRQRKAVVYLRQSSAKQVRENLESQRLQYALADRARDLGWSQVEIIDTDLGASASLGAAPRKGFDRLLALVARGEVGIVLSREISRLSRTDKDFCHLLEICQLFDTLIADEAQVYDPALMDDQLILGIKGTLSVVELKVLKMRMLEGALAKARRGELVRFPPSGYVWDPTGKVVKDPDQRVREAIELIFGKFPQCSSVRQTFKWFHDEGIELPVHGFEGGVRKLTWKLPSQSFIGSVLRNPYYAGVYYYGRRQTVSKLIGGKLVKSISGVLPAEKWRVFLRDHHEGYICWAQFEENQRMIRRNRVSPEDGEPQGALRGGRGLLAGLLRCGRCGRKLFVQYAARKRSPRYLCKGDYAAGGRYCLGLGGMPLDRGISRELLKVLTPLGVEASLEAAEQLSRRGDERRQALQRKVEQLDYEAVRAFEQYDQVDPRNRLVAARLEQRWNEALAELARSREALAELEAGVQPLNEEDREAILALGRGFAEVWNSPSCPVETKKKIVRTLVEEIVVDLDEGASLVRLVIHWRGDCHSTLELDRPGKQAQRTSEDSLEIIRRMAVRYGDDQIAATLNRLGHRTGKGKRWNEVRVATGRRNHSIPGQRRAQEDPEVLSMNGAARYCGVSETTIRRLVAEGILGKEQLAPYAPWEIRRSDLDSEPVRSLLERLRRTGRLELKEGSSAVQATLFHEESTT